MTGMVRAPRARGNIIRLDLRRGDSFEASAFLPGLAALLTFAFATCLAADLLAEAIVAWIGHDRNIAAHFILSTRFL